MNLAKDWPIYLIIAISAVDLFTGSIPFIGTMSNVTAETIQILTGAYLVMRGYQ